MRRRPQDIISQYDSRTTSHFVCETMSKPCLCNSSHRYGARVQATAHHGRLISSRHNGDETQNRRRTTKERTFARLPSWCSVSDSFDNPSPEERPSVLGFWLHILCTWSLYPMDATRLLFDWCSKKRILISRYRIPTVNLRPACCPPPDGLPCGCFPCGCLHDVRSPRLLRQPTG